MILNDIQSRWYKIKLKNIISKSLLWQHRHTTQECNCRKRSVTEILCVDVTGLHKLPLLGIGKAVILKVSYDFWLLIQIRIIICRLQIFQVVQWSVWYSYKKLKIEIKTTFWKSPFCNRQFTIMTNYSIP